MATPVSTDAQLAASSVTLLRGGRVLHYSPGPMTCAWCGAILLDLREVVFGSVTALDLRRGVYSRHYVPCDGVIDRGATQP